MPLAVGQTFGSYDIVGPLGAGGMGEVYRARDRRLKRDVAIKVLPAEFANDAERVARFQREAELLAALNHPNIAQVYGLEANVPAESGSHIVMELVGGDTLADRIARGPLPIDEAVAIARQIAEALDAAHRAGVIHRDLKPANIKVTDDGVVKVLDFGLGKASGDAAGGSSLDIADSPTVTSPAVTERGVILGTAAYMAPEQAKGRAVDKRADIWAFGCVLYEMLTGRRAFHGDSTTEVIAAVLEREPDLSRLPPSTPESIRRLLRRTVAKNPRQRLRDIGDAQFELHAEPDQTANAAAKYPVALIATVSAIAATIVTVMALRSLSTDARPPDPFVFAMDGGNRSDFTVSADGRTLAWVSTEADGRRRVSVRRTDTAEPKVVEGTDGAALPFLAPDGRAVAFFQDSQLKRIDLASGAAHILTTSPGVSLGGTWSVDDVVVYSNRFGMNRVPATGGQPVPVVPLNPAFHENSLRFPRFLPDGKHFLYVARSGRPDESGAYLASLDGKTTRLFSTHAEVAFAPPDRLLFIKDGVLVTQRLDVETATLKGDARTIATDVGFNATGMAAAYAVGGERLLIYSRSEPEAVRTFHWFDRTGRDLGTLEEPRLYQQFRIAPDGKRVAAVIGDRQRGGRSIWIYEAGQSPVRLTFADTHDWEPTWSPDGRRMAFSSYRNGPLDVFVKNADGASPDAPVLLSAPQKDISDWSPDGRYLVYREVGEGPTGSGNLWAVDVGDPQHRIAITHEDTDENFARWSRDGRWLAYVSNETGRREVFVQPFPPTGAKWQVSLNGGDEPAWGGNELFYIDRAGMLNAVTASGSTFARTASKPLFKIGSALGQAFSNRYDALRDGSRFLVAVDDPLPPSRPPVVLLNWTSLIQ